jgi:hypothetical protein
MDREGFSGNDGRTTIFDYWSVDTLCRAKSKQLTDDEKALFSIYNKVLNIARKEKAVGEGLMFDVMYVNRQYSRQYAFLRKAGKDMLLVVANFDDAAVRMDVTLPAHAFDYLEIKEKSYVATDLLTGAKHILALAKDAAVTLNLPPRGAVVLKLK